MIFSFCWGWDRNISSWFQQPGRLGVRTGIRFIVELLHFNTLCFQVPGLLITLLTLTFAFRTANTTYHNICNANLFF
jgi:hypothetical protein